MVPEWGRAVSVGPLCLEIQLCPGHRHWLKKDLLQEVSNCAHSLGSITNMNFLYSVLLFS